MIYTETKLSIDLAKRLKEKGADLQIYPRIGDVLSWLRDYKRIFTQISIARYGYVYSLYEFGWDEDSIEYEILHYDHRGFDSYEQAALKSIEYVIDYLI